MKLTKLYPNGKQKAFTLSYDDGVRQDIRLIEILNKCNLKGTFNLNSSLMSREYDGVRNGTFIGKIGKDEAPAIYQGHEVAVHSLTHPHLENLTYDEIVYEITEDIKKLEEIFGYEIRGMAYPFGTYNDSVLKALAEVGIFYSRTVVQHESFVLPENPLTWHATCHHKNLNLQVIIDRFLTTDEELALFYVWGHSYEFDMENNWEVIESLCEQISGKENVWYATNSEILTYINTANKLEITENAVYNPTDKSVWISADGTICEIKAGETKNF